MPPHIDLRRSRAPRRLGALAVSATVALGACAPMPAPPPPPAPPVEAQVPVCRVPVLPAPACLPAPVPPPDPVDQAMRHVVAYQERLRTLPQQEIARELARIGDPAGSPAATLELALLIGQTRNPADTVRALNLLDGVLRSTSPEVTPWQPIARVLAVRYAEQRRVEELLEKQKNELRDSQRRIEQLTSQLEALKAIERSLTNRPAGPPASAPQGRPR